MGGFGTLLHQSTQCNGITQWLDRGSGTSVVDILWLSPALEQIEDLEDIEHNAQFYRP